ncbi:MAG: ATP cone domain-containing protein [Patescibacteria group bacterium]
MINVTKSTGTIEPFSKEKVLASIQRAHIPKDLQDQIVKEVNAKLYNNIPTSEIYHHITEFLGASVLPYSRAKYSLKQGVMDLGPTGYPFEDFVADVLKFEGYQTNVRQILNGKCVKHEIDIVAQKDGVKSMIECKFHNSIGNHTQVHVSLYTKARFDDLKDIYRLDDVWLVTNTRITPDALSYALCNGLKVISWNYPENFGLRDLIEKSKLHPITVLATLSQAQKQQLLQQHIVLCKNICENPASLATLNLPKDKTQAVIDESKFVCS